MFVIGLGYFSQHKAVAAIPSARYALHYYLPREKAKKPSSKKNKKGTAIEPPQAPKDLHLIPVAHAPADSPDPEIMLKEFFDSSSSKKKILLVAGMNALFNIIERLKLHRKKLTGVILFDNPSNLFDYNIDVVDAEHIREGVWWKRKAFLEGDIVRVLKEYEDKKFKIKKLHKIRRKLVEAPEEAPSAKLTNDSREKRERGYLHTFVKDLNVILGTSSKRKAIMKSILGYAVGVEKRGDFKKTAKLLVKKWDIDKSLLKNYAKYLASKKGMDLFSVFYEHAKGESFRTLQGKYKHLIMDDWLTLGEWVSPTEKHKFFFSPIKR